MNRIILASASPRRRELLGQMGLEFEIVVEEVDETLENEMEPCEVVKQLALKKALAVKGKIDEDCVVIGADTVVAYGGRVLGKPQSVEDAFNMLSMLSGKRHKVCTGVAVVGRGISEVFCEETSVYMKSISGDEIWAYIGTGEPHDKAGAYGIQGLGALLVEKIEGDYNNVVGLPISRLYEVLKKEGLGNFIWQSDQKDI